MTLYYFVFPWLIVMYLFSKMTNVYCEVDCGGYIDYRWRFFAALVAFFPVIYLAAFTTERFDTVLYMAVYRDLSVTIDGLKMALTNTNEKGWVLFQWIIKRLFGDNVRIFRVILVSFHSIPVLFFFRKYSKYFLTSLYLFLACSCHLAWMMNGLRQYLAVSIIICTVPLILKRKYLPTFIIILLASTIHLSALMMIPIVFIAQGKPWNKKTLLFMAVAVVATYLFSKNTELLDSMLVNTTYAGSIDYSRTLGDDGVNPIRVLVYTVPPLIAFIGRRKIEEDNDPLINMAVNMSLVTAGLYLIAMVTSGIMIGRLPIYTSLFDFILLPYAVKRCFSEQDSRLINALMIVLFFAYYLFEAGVL